MSSNKTTIDSFGRDESNRDKNDIKIPKQLAKTTVTLLKPVRLNVCNDRGELRLGELLKWLDACSCMSAERLASHSCVTCIMDDLTFNQENMKRSPIRGEYVKLIGTVTRVWNSSMEVHVSAWCGSPRRRDERRFCSVYFVYVLFQKRKGQKLPMAVPSTAMEKQHHDDAQERKLMRIHRLKMVERLTMSDVLVKQPDDAPILTVASSIRPTKTSPESNVAQTSENTLIQFTELVLPPHANHMGGTFGGQIMCWMSRAANMSAWAHVSNHMSETSDFDLIPVCIDQINFKLPSHVGDRLNVTARVSRVFRTSMEIFVTVSGGAVDAKDPDNRTINEGFFTYAFVSKPEGTFQVGRAQPLPSMAVDETNNSVYEHALGRRLLRMKRRAIGLVLQIFSNIDSDGDGRITRAEIMRTFESHSKISLYLKRCGLEDKFADFLKTDDDEDASASERTISFEEFSKSLKEKLHITTATTTTKSDA